MNRRTTTAALIVLFTTSCLTGCAAQPNIDNYKTIGAYMRALDYSLSPQTITMRKQIADGPANLARQKQLATQEGLSLNVDTSMPPASENAAVSYQKWHDLQRKRKYYNPNYASFMSYKNAYTPEQLQWVRTLIKTHQPEFDLLHQIVHQPVMVTPPGSYRYGVDMMEAAREFVMESYPLLKDGRYQDAVDTQALGFQVKRQLEYRPTIMHYVNARFVENSTLSGFGNILYLTGPNAEIDSQVEQKVAAARSPLFLKRALEGDIGEQIYALEKIRAGTPQDLTNFVVDTFSADRNSPMSDQATIQPAERQFANNLLDAEEAQYLAAMRQYIPAAGEAPIARLQAFAQIDDSMTKSYPFPVGEFKSSDTSYSLWAQIDTNLRAHEQVTMAAAAILAQKAGTGAFPAKLPSGFTDPYTDMPLFYRRTGKNGFIVTCVGAEKAYSEDRIQEKTIQNSVRFQYPPPAPTPVPKDELLLPGGAYVH